METLTQALTLLWQLSNVITGVIIMVINFLTWKFEQ